MVNISDFENAKEILNYLRRSVRPKKIQEGKGFFIPDEGFREPATEDFYRAAVLLAQAEGDPLTAARIAVESAHEGYDFKRIAEKLYEEAYKQARTVIEKAFIYHEAFELINVERFFPSDYSSPLELYMEAIEEAEKESPEKALKVARRFRFSGCGPDFLRLYTKVKGQVPEEWARFLAKHSLANSYLRKLEERGRKEHADEIRRLLEKYQREKDE
ncbi:MAG: hypothetical protein DRP63_00785 [Planctomycetota bacterium]|mgnify:CR=1 FL=1|nr:MAG: hypothetical protein DRP63_00785 [Planctomycetota bacterium]